MNAGVYQFVFANPVPLLDAEMSLHLAILAAEGLFGEVRVRMEVGYHLDEAHRLLIVDGSSEAGFVVVQIFAGLLLRQYGRDAFEVRQMESATPGPRSVAYAGAA